MRNSAKVRIANTTERAKETMAASFIQSVQNVASAVAVQPKAATVVPSR